MSACQVQAGYAKEVPTQLHRSQGHKCISTAACVNWHCNTGLFLCVTAELAMAGLSIISSGRPDRDICHWVAPRDDLAADHPSRHLHHPGCCRVSRVYSLCFAGSLHDAPDAQQAPCKRCYQKDEPARLGKATVGFGYRRDQRA